MISSTGIPRKKQMMADAAVVRTDISFSLRLKVKNWLALAIDHLKHSTTAEAGRVPLAWTEACVYSENQSHILKHKLCFACRVIPSEIEQSTK